MNFIDGYVLSRTKYILDRTQIISDVYISSIEDPIYPNEHVVTDFNGNICFFDCVHIDDSSLLEFKGLLKYKIGKSKYKFTLEKDLKKSGHFLIIDNQRYSILNNFTNNNTYLLQYDNCNLVNFTSENEEASKLLIPKFEVLKSEIRNEKYLEIVNIYLSTLIYKNNPELRYFSLSNISNIFGYLFYFYKDGFLYLKIFLVSEFYNIIELFNYLKINDGSVHFENKGKNDFFKNHNIDENVVKNITKVPFYPNSYFILSSQGREIYSSRKYDLKYIFPNVFLNKVISCILLEEKIIFCSKEDSFLKIMYILSLIRPFCWQHILIIPLLKEIDCVIDSPLPYIVFKYRDTIKETDNVVIDLDLFTVNNYYGPVISFDRNISHMLSMYISLKKMICVDHSDPEEIINVIFNPNCFSECEKAENVKLKNLKLFQSAPIINEGRLVFSKYFLRSFFNTRLFLKYISDVELCNFQYLVDISDTGSIDIVHIPHAFLNEDMKIDVINLYIELYDEEIDQMIDWCSHNNVLKYVAGTIFKKLSFLKEYKRICEFYSYLMKNGVDIDYSIVRNINFYDYFPILEHKDLNSVNIYLVNECSCKYLFFENKRIFRMDNHPLVYILDKNSIEAFDIDSKINCMCKKYKSLIFVEECGAYVGYHYLITVSNLRTIIYTHKYTDIKKEAPSLYYIIITYFTYFKLPLNFLKNVEVDYMIRSKDLSNARSTLYK